MPTYQSPGVYVEEISTGARPIEAVGTSTAGFIGAAPDPKAYEHKVRWIENWSQFVQDFLPKEPTKPATATDKERPLPSSPAAPPPREKPPTPEQILLSQRQQQLANAVFGFFLNGGSRCCVVNVGTGGLVANPLNGRRRGLELLEETDEVAIIAAPGFNDTASHDALLTHCEGCKNRVAILDGPAGVDNIQKLTNVGTAQASGTAAAQDAGFRPRTSDAGFGAFYFPWITVRDALDPSVLIDVPPSGHIAGIYARSDSTRGVHKAPANEIVRGAVNVTYRITRGEQGSLNPNGVNCIRLFPNEGIRVYGARTVAPSSSEFRYLNVRRLLNQIEESIARNTGWVVFEPNDRPLWKSITRDVSAFLMLLWRQGALMGRTPEEAFFVKCDDETNPEDVINAGQVITVIGVAPVKPAEFVIFRIGQGTGGGAVEAEGAAGAQA